MDFVSKACLAFLALFAVASAAPPNIIFIMTDQQSADTMSSRMGDRYLKTPAMDALAARGTSFTRAYTPNPLCMPARNSIFTGRYPHETGITDNTKITLDASEFVSMGTYFQHAGYQTAYFGKWHLAYDEAATTTHGFETREIGHMDANTAAKASAFLARKHDKPFLLVVSFFNPHNVCELARGQELNNGPIGEPPSAEYLPPAPANLTPPRNEPDTMTQIRAGYHANPQFPVGNFNPQMWQALRWGYYRLIEKVDAEIGRVLDALKATDLEKNTLVVFTSDHGECAGAHGFNQKTVFNEESARVPFIVSVPGQRVARTSEKLINTGTDILPTLLDFAGVARPAKLPGLSLRPLALGEQVATWRDDVVVQNNMSQTYAVRGNVPTTEGRMLRTDRYKYCVYVHGQNRESLVDLEKDPGETINLSRDPAHRETLLAMRERLRQWGIANHDPLVAEMLADDVKPRDFAIVKTPKNAARSEGLAKQKKKNDPK
jgi:choline-sulfatase